MCGIAGYYHSHKLNESSLRKMTDSILHRGPDGSGEKVFEKTKVGLGHRRLAILDLSPLGHQPMHAGENSTLWITYNGEIYNFKEIRFELEKKGHKFTTQTDTEVVLKSYLEWGENAFLKFNGMWALALYDESEDSLLLCRDRYGIKPLYYFKDDLNFVFGSEYKVFKSIKNEIDLKWDERGISTALFDAGLLEGSGYTLFKNLKSVPAGTLLKISKNEIKIKKWWEPADHVFPSNLKYENQIEDFKNLFLDACKIRLVSDVPVTTSLSGGLDSSAVACALHYLSKKNETSFENFSQKTFTHRFSGSLDEYAFAKEVANQTGADLISIEANETDVKNEIDKVLTDFESIYFGLTDSSWRLYQAQRKNNVYVTLDGHGADELLGGYDWYLSAQIIQNITHPLQLKSLYKQFKDQLGEGYSFLRFVRSIGKSYLSHSLDLNRLTFNLKNKNNVLAKSENYFLKFESLYSLLPLKIPEHLDLTNKLLFNDFHLKLLPRILKNFDLMSMAHGVEVRMPFMDYRLVNYSFSLPSDSKVGGGFSKRILRDSLKDILPEKIRLRKSKIGFNSPLPHLLAGPLKSWVYEVLNQSVCEFDKMIDKKTLKKFYEKKILSKDANWNEVMKFWSCISALRLGQLFLK